MYNTQTKALIDTIDCGGEVVVGMSFGTFGREAGTLAMSFKSGGLRVVMLGRT